MISYPSVVKVRSFKRGGQLSTEFSPTGTSSTSLERFFVIIQLHRDQSSYFQCMREGYGSHSVRLVCISVTELAVVAATYLVYHTVGRLYKDGPDTPIYVIHYNRPKISAHLFHFIKATDLTLSWFATKIF